MQFLSVIGLSRHQASYAYILSDKLHGALVVIQGRNEESQYFHEIVSIQMLQHHTPFVVAQQPVHSRQILCITHLSHGSGWLHLAIPVASIDLTSSAFANTFLCKGVSFWKVCLSPSRVRHLH
jgi:hypothetical protein